jgi:hypothetical protein
VAFVALSEEAEYAYAWLLASVVHVAFAPPESAASAVNEDVMAGVQTHFFGSGRQRRQAEVTRAELLV